MKDQLNITLQKLVFYGEKRINRHKNAHLVQSVESGRVRVIKNDRRKRTGKRKRSSSSFIHLAEIKPSQLVATESKDISATVGTVDLVLSLSVPFILVPFISLLKCECIFVLFLIAIFEHYIKSTIFLDLYSNRWSGNFIFNIYICRL